MTGARSQLARPAQNANVLAVSPAGEAAIFRSDGVDGSRLYLTTRDGRVVELAHINGFLRDISETPTTTISYTAPGTARELSSCLLLPPNWTAAQRYPTIVQVYPGSDGRIGDACRDSASNRTLLGTERLLAAHGYVVLYASMPSDLIRTAAGPTRGATPLVEAAIHAAVARGFTDPDRVGIYGFSQGYNLALQILTESHIFRAGALGSGITDFGSHYFEMALNVHATGVPEDYSAMSRYEAGSANSLGAAPWANPGLYAANSPIASVQNISAPILIFHSDFDMFPLAQSEQLFSALYRLRKEAEYAVYWGENHGNTTPANARDIWERLSRWYDTHLSSTHNPS